MIPPSVLSRVRQCGAAVTKRGPISVLLWNLFEVVLMVGVGIAIGYCAALVKP